MQNNPCRAIQQPPTKSNKNLGAFSASCRKEVLLSMLQSLGHLGTPVPSHRCHSCNTAFAAHVSASATLPTTIQGCLLSLVVCPHWISQQQRRTWVKKIGPCRPEHVLKGGWARCHLINLLGGWCSSWALDFGDLASKDPSHESLVHISAAWIHVRREDAQSGPSFCSEKCAEQHADGLRRKVPRCAI